MATTDSRPLVAHVVHRFDMGGLENGVVNLINRMAPDRFRHAVVALTTVGDFRRRIERDDVEFVALDKPPGQGLKVAPKAYALFRRMSPAIVHTRNIGALEMSLPAMAARVPVRVHGEHGWDSADPDGSNRTYQWIRRAYRPLVHRYVALSRHIERYLAQRVGVAPGRITQIYNGVDAVRFRPAAGGRERIHGCPFEGDDLWVVGTVGRQQPIKDPLTLVKAFAHAVATSPAAARRMRLLLAGGGPLHGELAALVGQAGLQGKVWLAGERQDVPEVMRGLDAFVLPSRAEGISNTILEAMATALPVVATAVGGNTELLSDGSTGRLVEAANVEAMAAAMVEDMANPRQAEARGRAARSVVEARFSLDAMVRAYENLYDSALARALGPGALQRA